MKVIFICDCETDGTRYSEFLDIDEIPQIGSTIYINDNNGDMIISGVVKDVNYGYKNYSSDVNITVVFKKHDKVGNVLS